jgi:hypothetical protein
MPKFTGGIFQPLAVSHQRHHHRADALGRRFHLLQNLRLHAPAPPGLAELDAQILELRQYRCDLACGRRVFVHRCREDFPKLQRVKELHLTASDLGIDLWYFVVVGDPCGYGLSVVFCEALYRDGTQHVLSADEISRVFDVHARLYFDPACRTIDARHSGRQFPSPAGSDQRKRTALVTGGNATDTSERIGPHVTNFDHVVATPRIRSAQDGSVANFAADGVPV